MEIEYDPAKDKANQEKHGLSFEAIIDFDFANALIIPDTRFDYGEDRLLAFGLIKQRLFIICYTKRENKRRIISFRKANKREVKIYETINQ